MTNKTPNKMTESKVILPDILMDHQLDGERHLRLKMPENLLYFDGHFDQASILPGVVQLQWAVHFGREFFGIDGEFCRLEAIKYQHVVEPLDEVSLYLSNKPDTSKLYFRFVDENRAFSSGRIVYKANPS